MRACGLTCLFAGCAMADQHRGDHKGAAAHVCGSWLWPADLLAGVTMTLPNIVMLRGGQLSMTELGGMAWRDENGPGDGASRGIRNALASLTLTLSIRPTSGSVIFVSAGGANNYYTSGFWLNCYLLSLPITSWLKREAKTYASFLTLKFSVSL